ncbi:MAG: hypothetical protein JNG85_17755 [Spirochaetaceae bacterium]|nr:hypothetical protein [Spirochaetaceae bacterium]
MGSIEELMTAREEIRRKALALTERVLPLVLAAAFVMSYWTFIGTRIIIGLCLWFALLNFRAVFRDRWAMIVLGFFALIAAKDAAMALFADGRLLPVIKSSSRVVVLFGSAALLRAYPRERLERILGAALGVTALCMTVYWAEIVGQITIIPGGVLKLRQVFQQNTPGMLSLWFPLFLLPRALKGSGWKKTMKVFAILAVSSGVLFFDSSFGGSRVAPVAFGAAAVYVLIAPRIPTRISLPALVLLMAIGTTALTIWFSPKINDLLFYRQDLWRGYAGKALERPITGWGFTNEKANMALLEERMRGTLAYPEFHDRGLGPHNSLVAMLFENGAILAAAYAVMLLFRARRAAARPGFLDASFLAFIVLMANDAMNPGGVRFLGFFLGICLLAADTAEAEPDE